MKSIYFSFNEKGISLFHNQNNCYGCGRDSVGFTIAEQVFLGTILYSQICRTEDIVGTGPAQSLTKPIARSERGNGRNGMPTKISVIQNLT